MIPLRLQDIIHAIQAADVQVSPDGVIPAVCTDSRDITPGCLFVALTGDRFNGHDYVEQALAQGAVCAVVMQPGNWPADRVLHVKETRQALMRIARLVRRSLDVRVAGITGSVGKTTTKEMTACVMASRYSTLKTPANLNNEVGLSQTMLMLEPQHQVAVLELGVDGPGQMRLLSTCAEPDIGILTGIGVSHLAQFGSRERIRGEKLDLRSGMPDGATLILNADDDLLAGTEDSRLRILRFGVESRKVDARALNINEYSTHTTYEILYNGTRFDAQLPCFGTHNVLNSLAAFLAGVSLGIPPHQAILALRNYRPEGMRQRVVQHAGFTVVEDCYNASPDSMRAALTTLGRLKTTGRKIAVLSDMLELGGQAESAHLEIGVFAAQAGVDLLLCTGPLSESYIAGAEESGFRNAVHYPDSDALFTAIRQQVREGDTLWFKASRGMKLEQVMNRIYEEC